MSKQVDGEQAQSTTPLAKLGFLPMNFRAGFL
jgi:hypothetical protein